MSIDWPAILIPQNPIAEVIVRGTIIYFLLFFVLRFFLNRQAVLLAFRTCSWSS